MIYHGFMDDNPIFPADENNKIDQLTESGPGQEAVGWKAPGPDPALGGGGPKPLSPNQQPRIDSLVPQHIQAKTVPIPDSLVPRHLGRQNSGWSTERVPSLVPEHLRGDAAALLEREVAQKNETVPRIRQNLDDFNQHHTRLKLTAERRQQLRSALPVAAAVAYTIADAGSGVYNSTQLALEFQRVLIDLHTNGFPDVPLNFSDLSLKDAVDAFQRAAPTLRHAFGTVATMVKMNAYRSAGSGKDDSARDRLLTLLSAFDTGIDIR